MRFRLVEDLLNEDIAAVQARYPDIPENTFMKLIRLDPTYNPERDSVGTYGKWILNLYNKGNLDNIGHVKDVLGRFESNKRQLKVTDIGRFKSIEELDSFMNDENNYKELTQSQKVRANQNARKLSDLSKEAELVFTGDGYEVWVPHTYAASCKLGHGATWCTASTEGDYYYNEYTKAGWSLYILRKDNEPVYQICFEDGEFMDTENHPQDLGAFLNENTELKGFFLPKVEKMLKIDTIPEGGSVDIDFSGREIETLNKCYKEYSSHYSGRRGGDLDIETCVDILDDPDRVYYDYSYLTYDDAIRDLPEFDSYVKEKLTELGIDPDNFKDSIESISDEEYAFVEDVCDALTVSYKEGRLAGCQDEAISDILYSFRTCGLNYYNDKLSISIEKEKILNSYFDGNNTDLSNINYYYFSDIKQAVAAAYICDNFECSEPYYGWDGFSNEVFNDRFYDELSGIER